MAVIYEDAFQCMNCGLFPPLGTLYRCILDRESLIQDAYNDGYSVSRVKQSWHNVAETPNRSLLTLSVVISKKKCLLESLGLTSEVSQTAAL